MARSLSTGAPVPSHAPAPVARVPGRNGHGRTEQYQQSCAWCGHSGRITCRLCHGSGTEDCAPCGGHGLFTDITEVTVCADPCISIDAHSELSRAPLVDFLTHFPVSQVVQHLEFRCTGHDTPAEDTWRVRYDVSTTAVELDLELRHKRYMAAAIGHGPLAFVKPPIFDDVFIEEITDLKRIWSGKTKSFSNDRARTFFAAYAGQPALDAAMQAVAKLTGQARETPVHEVHHTCNGYISEPSARLLGTCMAALLDKVSPPNSLWSWAGVMMLPFGLVFLGAQNWFELHAPRGYGELFMAWCAAALVAALLSVLVSPFAATLSAIVSFIRRRAVPPEYRQHGRNWRPLKSFLAASVAMVSLGAVVGVLTHHGSLPRWENAPLDAMETTLDLDRFAPYAKASAWARQAGFFASAVPSRSTAPETEAVVRDIQNNLRRIGYRVEATGRLDSTTRQAIATYIKKRKLGSHEPQAVLASLCADLKGACSDFFRMK